MPSSDVISALDTLHKKLEKLEPAIKNVELATEVTRMVHAIPTRYEQLLQEIEQEEIRFKEQLVGLCKTELDQITEARKSLFEVMEMETERLAETAAQTQQTVREAVDESRRNQEELVALKQDLHQFVAELSPLNIPGRFDVLEADLAELKTLTHPLPEVQKHLASQLGSLEEGGSEGSLIQNLTNQLKQQKEFTQRELASSLIATERELKSLEKRLDSRLIQMQEEWDQKHKTQQLLAWISVFLLFILSAGMIFIGMQVLNP